MEFEITLKTNNIKEIFGFDQYQKLFRNETYYYWNHLWQIVTYTKSYKQGIEIALALLERFELYKNEFSKEEQEKQLILIYTQLLNMLDKADLWEDYLRNWEIIKKKVLSLNWVTLILGQRNFIFQEVEEIIS